MRNPFFNNAKNIVCFIGLLGSGVACSGAAPTVIAFDEGEQFNLSLSSINFNRVYIEGETITKLAYPERSITVDKSEMELPDVTEGSVYIKPNFEVPITLFLTTDKGHHLSLTLTPDESVGKTLKLVARTQTQLKYVKSETHDVTEVDEAMLAMKSGDVPREFKTERVIPSPFYIKKDIKVILEKQYKGTRMTGYVYRLQNKSNHKVTLTTDMFSHQNAQSLALSEEQLQPKQIAYLYGLYNNEG